MSELKSYGWGFLDKNGQTTNQFMSTRNENLLEYKLALLTRERPNDAPFRIVPLFYKAVSD